MNLIVRWIFFVTTSLFLAACQTVQTSVPESFARDKDVEGKGVILGALDPFGSMYRVRTITPDEEGNFEFWTDALDRHLKESGYVSLSEKEVTVSGKKGRQLEYNVPMSSEDHIYQVSLFSLDDEILLVEASSERKRFDQLRTKLDKAIKGIKIK